MSKTVAIIYLCDNTDADKELLTTAKTTYMKNVVDDSVEGFSFYACMSMTDDEITNAHHKHVGTYNASENMVYVPVKASSSYDKLMCIVKTIHNYLETVDYMLITNTTTYINVDMLYQFVNSLNDNDETIYCCQVCNSKTYSSPYTYCVYPNCKATLIPLKYYFEVLMKTQYKNLADKMDENTESEDRTKVVDYAIGRLIDSYLLSNSKEHTSYYRNWNHSKYSDITSEDDYKNYMSIDLSDEEDISDKITSIYNNVKDTETSEYDTTLNEFFADEANHFIYSVDDDKNIPYEEYVKDIIEEIKKKSHNNPFIDLKFENYWQWFNIYGYCPYWISSVHSIVLINGSSLTPEDLLQLKADVDKTLENDKKQDNIIAEELSEISAQRELIQKYITSVEQQIEIIGSLDLIKKTLEEQSAVVEQQIEEHKSYQTKFDDLSKTVDEAVKNQKWNNV